MRKILSVFLVLAMLLSVLGGCGKKEEIPETVETTTEPIIETVATEITETATESTIEVATEATTEPEINDTVFKAGTWMAQCGPTSRYYFFDEGGASGSFANMKDGTGDDFTYIQTGGRGVLSLSGSSAGASCTVVVQDEDHITLEWDNQPPETMTYVSPLGQDQFHFYTHEELAQMALDDYWAKNYPDGALQAAAMDNGDGTSTIQIYQNLGDHNSTAAYYVVDRCTGEGFDVNHTQKLDLTNGTQDMDIYYRNPDALLSPDMPYLVLSETEYTQQIVLHPLVTVTDFRVVSIEMLETEGDFAFRVVKELFGAASMGPETGLVLFTELPEIIPNLGVIYKDRNGQERFCSVSWSGLDGSALLIEETLMY